MVIFMSQEEATDLWDSILEFATATGECWGEGNSGEFHEAAEAERLEAERAKVLGELVERFAKATGWMPIQPAGSSCSDDSWVLYAVSV